MTGLIHGGPLIVLREDRGGPSKVRVDRIMAYLRKRDARRARAWRRERQQQEREAAKASPCVYCGAQTEWWDRTAGIGICGNHHRSMPGCFPFRRGVFPADLPKALETELFVARKALYVLEKLVRQEEVHARQVR